MSSSLGQPTQICTICRVPPRGVALRSLHGELTCQRHETARSCAICARPCPVNPGAEWSSLGPGVMSCPTCAQGAVTTQDDVRRLLPRIKAELADLGFALRQPVRVTLTGHGELDALTHGPLSTSGTTFGVTRLLEEGQVGSFTVLNVLILRGLPGAVFGRTVAHEAAHAWAAQVGARAAEPAIEEGLCELIAYAWLKRQAGPLADGLRACIAANPDPTYGDGFRAVQAAVRVHGIRAVLASLQQGGRLPLPARSY